jgi:CheY-like chemotaxis protein
VSGRNVVSREGAVTLSSNVLLIDDDAVGLMARKALLESRGYSVVTSATDSEAEQVLQSTPVDLVISDHFLRSTTGDRVVHRVKQIMPAMPVIVVSGALRHELPPEALRGADAFVSKSEGPEALLEIVAALLKR